jgi:WD40 repeat protein
MRKQELLAIKPSSDTLELLQYLHQFLETPALKEAQEDKGISYAEFHKFLQQFGKQMLLQLPYLEDKSAIAQFLQQWRLATEDNSKRDIQLPDEIWCHIFGFFKQNELRQIVSVSKQFYDLVNSVSSSLDCTIPPKYQFVSTGIKGSVHQVKMLGQDRLIIALSYDQLKAIDQDIVLQLADPIEKLNAYICIFDIETGKCLQALNSYMNWVKSIKLTPNNEIICYGNGILQILDLTTGQCKKGLKSSAKYCIDMAILPNDNVVTLSNENLKNILEVWDHTMETCKHRFSDVGRFIVLPNGDVAYGQGQAVMLWDSQAGKSEHLYSHSFSVGALVAMSNGDMISSSSSIYEGEIKIWHRKTKENKLIYQSDPIHSIVVFSNGDIVSSADNEIRIWDGYTGHCKCILNLSIPEIRQDELSRFVSLELLNENILMSHQGKCDHLIFWQFSEVKKLSQLTQESRPTHRLSIRGQSKILPGNLGMKTDCTEEELENFRLRLEAQFYSPPVVEYQRRRPAFGESLSLFFGKKKTDSNEFSRGQPEIFPDNLGMKMDCSKFNSFGSDSIIKAQLENIRSSRMEVQHYNGPLSLIPPPSIIEEHNPWLGLKVVDGFSDDEEETDSDEFSEEPDCPAASIRSP